MLRLFEKMYDDMKPKAQNLRDRAPDAFEKIANNSSFGSEKEPRYFNRFKI